MNLKTLFWEAVQAYIFFNSLLKGSKAQGRLTGLTSSDARTDDTAMCTECHMLRVVRDQPLLRTLGQGHSLLYNAPHSLNTTISTRLPRSWGYYCFTAHCSLLPWVVFGVTCLCGDHFFLGPDFHSWKPPLLRPMVSNSRERCSGAEDRKDSQGQKLT